jgi:hypothetical protein
MLQRVLTFAAALVLAGAAEARAFNTYANIAVKTEDRAKVIETLQNMGRRAIVSPTTAGWITIYDAAAERMPKTLPDVAQKISAALKCPAVAAFDDNDSLLTFITFDKEGKQVDAYVSNPGYYEGKKLDPVGGDPAAIQAALGLSGLDGKLKEIFQDKIIELEFERHGNLISTLGMPYYCRGAGHKYFHDNLLPWKYDRASFEIIGQP